MRASLISERKKETIFVLFFLYILFAVLVFVVRYYVKSFNYREYILSSEKYILTFFSQSAKGESLISHRDRGNSNDKFKSTPQMALLLAFLA